MGTVNEWYTEPEITSWLEREQPLLVPHAAWLTMHLNSAFQKGRQIGRGELVEEQGGEMALLAEHSKLREWRRTRGFSLVPMSERFECSIVEASALERGKLVRAELVHKAQSLLANPDK